MKVWVIPPSNKLKVKEKGIMKADLEDGSQITMALYLF